MNPRVLIAGGGPLFGGNDGSGTNPELNVDGDAFFEAAQQLDVLAVHIINLPR